MKWTMPYPWRSRRDSVCRINMSSEPGNESFFCALRPIPRILSLRRRDYASQVQIGEPSRRKTISGSSRAPDANRYGARCRCKEAIDQLHCSAKTRVRLCTDAGRKLSPRRQARRSIAAAGLFFQVRAEDHPSLRKRPLYSQDEKKRAQKGRGMRPFRALDRFDRTHLTLLE